MPDYDEANLKMTVKLVYYGPAQSGKTTNLSAMHDHLTPDLKGEMMMLETKGDRTLFFDLLPLGVRCPSGLVIKLKVFTVPGQVAHDSTRKAVLSRADGVVFVADSQTTQSVNNLEAFENLAANLSKVGLDIESIPLVIQFNKRDLPDIVTEDEVNERWSATPWRVFFTSALKNEGVVETFQHALAALYQHLDASFQIETKHQLSESAFIEALTRRE